MPHFDYPFGLCFPILLDTGEILPSCACACARVRVRVRLSYYPSHKENQSDVTSQLTDFKMPIQSEAKAKHKQKEKQNGKH